MADALDELLSTLPGADAPPGPAPAWHAFPAEAGSLAVPRASMPQIKSEHRGAMVQFLKGRGITHEQAEILPGTLKPSQAEYSPEKVNKARTFDGPQRSILVSSDGYVVDGHHQWLASLEDEPDTPIPAIWLNAPVHQLLVEAARFPSSGVDRSSAAGSPPVTPPAAQDPLDALLDGMAGAPARPQPGRARPRTPQAPAVAAPAPAAAPAPGPWSGARARPQ